MRPLASAFLRFVPFLATLLGMIFFVPNARADFVQFSFSVDPVGCTFFPAGTCSDPTAGSGIFTVTPVNLGMCTNGQTLYRITSVAGEINGHDMTFLPNVGACDDNLLSLSGSLISFGAQTRIHFAANDQQWAFVKEDLVSPPGTRYGVWNINTNKNLPIAWSAQVTVPEPSTLLSLGISLLALLLVSGKIRHSASTSDAKASKELS